MNLDFFFKRSFYTVIFKTDTISLCLRLVGVKSVPFNVTIKMFKF